MAKFDMSGAHDFDFIIGKWRVRHHTLAGRLVGATEWSIADAVDIVHPVFCGLGNIGKFMRLVDGVLYEGMPTRLYDPNIGKWRIYWLDNIDHRMEPAVIGGFKNGEGLFIGDDVLRGDPIKVRFRWTDITPVSARWDQAFSSDGGTTWELNSIMEFSRDETLPNNPQSPLPEQRIEL